MSDQAHVIRLARRPGAEVTAADFAVTPLELPKLAPGEVLVRNTWMSLDPYMRLPLSGQAGVHAPMAVGEEMRGAAVGVVEESAAPGLPVGTTVVSQRGWRDRFVAPAAELQRVDNPAAHASWHVGILGLIGLTAWAGIESAIQPQAGESLFVSGAAGAVGSVACQLAKQRGARVLGSAGSDAKVAWLLDEIGVDAAMNYKRQDTAAFLAEHCPGGLDLYFDNVGGATLDAALAAMRQQGRMGLCGAIAQYNDANYRAGPKDFFAIIEKNLTVVGFTAGLWRDRSAEVFAALRPKLESGELVWRETIVEGLHNAPAAFTGLFSGENIGKLVVKLA